jgi:Ca2+:H+ antiporter
MGNTIDRAPWWAWTWPLVGFLAFAATLFGAAVSALLMGVILISVVFAAVYHAEVIAHRVGEPFGTLVLAVSVTVIEVALIVSMMIEGGADKAGLARDTVLAAILITCGGIVGVCLVAGGVRHHEQGFQYQGALGALAVLIALSVLTLIIPNVTISAPSSELSSPQLIFAGIVSIVLYASFVFVQTVRHRDFFLPPVRGDEEAHAAPPSNAATIASVALLLVALAAVVGLAKSLSPALEELVFQAGAPKAVVGIAIAALVLMPEGLAAYRAAKLDRLQTSMNLALGSALASIGLTIPAVAAVAIVTGHPLQLGLAPKEATLLGLTLLVSVVTLGTGRTTILQGIVHLSIFAAFLFYAFVP